jgi:sulfite exporter TauE/SafE
MGLAFVLGLRHSFEPDHMAAVATIVSQTHKVKQSSLTGMFWGPQGISVCGAGFALLALRVSVPDDVSAQLDRIVGVMLIFLGCSLFWKISQTHIHQHAHGDLVHSHLHSHSSSSDHRHRHQSLFVGMTHGLLGSGSLVVLALAATASSWIGAAYLVIFGVGVVISMGVIAGIFGLTVRATRRSRGVLRSMQFLAATASLVIGLSFSLSLGLIPSS